MSESNTGQWDSDYADRNEWCEECDDLFNADCLKDGLCQRCRYLDTRMGQDGEA